MNTMTLILDDADYATIQEEITLRQTRARKLGTDTYGLLPDGESNLAGAILAECVRDLRDYRDLMDKRREG
ncbi:MAG TPA: hypothetical protein VD932_02425 [Aquabacterium sp.]|nr:hypothetical protein [Aquabacterium sp.]